MYLEVEHLRKKFESEEVLRGVGLSLARNRTLSILGRSGSGKTTLLKIMAGLLAPDGGQIRLANMDERAISEPPNAGRLMPALDESFDGVILLGHHARAGTPEAFLDHTVSSAAWFEYRLNDQVLGEIGIEAAWAGHYGVPVIAVSGDEATAREARADLGEVECAVVKWAVGRNRARCLPPARAHREIRDAIAQAMGSMDRFQPFRPSLPATIQLTLYRSDMADDHCRHGGIERVDGRTIRRQIDSLMDVVRW